MVRVVKTLATSCDDGQVAHDQLMGEGRSLTFSHV